VVHGHTPAIEPDIRPNRINIDTGAYATGRLTCLVLEGNEMSFL
jgi:serine/threonine protein phosphatase 1